MLKFIDGEPRSHHDIKDPKTGEVTDTVWYRVVGFLSQHKIILEAMQAQFMDQLHRLLPDGTVYWRRHHTYDRDFNTNMWRWSCRLETRPELPEEFWRDWEYKKGVIPELEMHRVYYTARVDYDPVKLPEDPV